MIRLSRRPERTKRKPQELSREEVVKGLRRSFEKLLLSLYAASRLAETEEEKTKVAELIQLAGKIEAETMADLGEPSQQAELRALVSEISDLSNLAQALDKEIQIKKPKSPRKKRQKLNERDF